jgi:hypothetical protein
VNGFGALLFHLGRLEQAQTDTRGISTRVERGDKSTANITLVSGEVLKVDVSRITGSSETYVFEALARVVGIREVDSKEVPLEPALDDEVALWGASLEDLATDEPSLKEFARNLELLSVQRAQGGVIVRVGTSVESGRAFLPYLEQTGAFDHLRLRALSIAFANRDGSMAFETR